MILRYVFFSGVSFMNIMLNLGCLKESKIKINPYQRQWSVWTYEVCIVCTLMYTLKYQIFFFLSIKLYWLKLTKSTKQNKIQHKCFSITNKIRAIQHNISVNRIKFQITITQMVITLSANLRITRSQILN